MGVVLLHAKEWLTITLFSPGGSLALSWARASQKALWVMKLSRLQDEVMKTDAHALQLTKKKKKKGRF